MLMLLKNEIYIKNSFIVKLKIPLSKHENRRILPQSHIAQKHAMDCLRVMLPVHAVC